MARTRQPDEGQTWLSNLKKRNRCTALTFSALVLPSGSGLTPVDVNKWPMKGTSDNLSFSFLGFSFKFTSLALSNYATKLQT